jgi:hypothetical protein
MSKRPKMSEHVPSALPAGLRASQVARTRDVVTKLERAFADIEREMEQSGGIYPQNRGRLSQAEVCRRADVDPMTLYGENHKKSTKAKVDEWLAKVRGTSVQGKRAVRRTITERADRWKANLDAIAEKYHLAELESIELRATVADLQSKCDALERENQLLRIQVSEGRVVTLPRRSP